MTRFFQIIAALLVLVALPAAAHADDWLVTKLRGQVLQLVDGQWAPLKRGDVVPDERVLRSTNSGRAELQRGKETIEMASNTQIRILDQEGKRFTTVQQFAGTVAIEAEVQNVQHFAVQTPYLAAVVKGTRFEVKTTAKQSAVKVTRGRVAVEDLHTGAHTLVVAGQAATVGKNGSFTVSGQGVKPEILSSTGKPVAAADAAKGLVSGSVSGSGVSASVGGAVNASVGPGGVNAGVNTGVVNGNVSVGGGGIGAGVDVPGAGGVDVGAGPGGVSVGADLGGTGVGVDIGGNGIGIEIGGGSLNIGGGLF